MEIDKVYSGKSLKAADLGDREPILTITQVDFKKFDNANKIVLSFDGTDKQLVVNKTNAKRIAKSHGSNTDGWVGKKIQLFVDQVEFSGDIVDAIRVRTPKSLSDDKPAFDDEVPF